MTSAGATTEPETGKPTNTTRTHHERTSSVATATTSPDSQPQPPGTRSQTTTPTPRQATGRTGPVDEAEELAQLRCELADAHRRLARWCAWQDRLVDVLVDMGAFTAVLARLGHDLPAACPHETDLVEARRSIQQLLGDESPATRARSTRT